MRHGRLRSTAISLLLADHREALLRNLGNVESMRRNVRRTALEIEACKEFKEETDSVRDYYMNIAGAHLNFKERIGSIRSADAVATATAARRLAAMVKIEYDPDSSTHRDGVSGNRSSPRADCGERHAERKRKYAPHLRDRDIAQLTEKYDTA